METLDQALRNIPYLLSLNKKPRVPFPINFTTNQNNSVPFQKTLMNLQRITSNESSILEKSNLHVSKHLNEPGNKSSILRSPPRKK